MSIQDTPSGVALWRQVADGIERGIADGRFAAGEKLPGEMEIAGTYRVNRHTVRRALATLAERGLVRAERGSGTYVETRAPRLSAALTDALLGDRRRRGGSRAASSSTRLRKPPARAGARSSTEDGRAPDPDRIGPAADRAPICVSTTWLSAERFPDAGRIFANVRSMTKLLAHYGIRDFRRASTGSPPVSWTRPMPRGWTSRSDVPCSWWTAPTSIRMARRW